MADTDDGDDKEGSDFSVLNIEEDIREDEGDSDGDIFLFSLAVFFDIELC